jgi:type I restriction enzyme S subunit
MDMSPGRKQTDVGVIPEDWEAVQLPDVVWFQEGPGLRKWQFRPNGLKVINVTNLQEDGYLDISTTERHISWKEFGKTYRHFLVDDGDVVMASSGNSYCKTAIVRSRDLPLLMNTSVIRFKAKQELSRMFMLIYLKSKYFKGQIDLMITGGAQPNFGPYHLKRILVPLPPTKAEQEVIAEALGDADALIESLDQLLVKKRRLKQGAMQELLAGRKRLPGFSGEWEVKRLGDLGTFLKGSGVTRDESFSGPLACIRYGEIYTRHNNCIKMFYSWISRDVANTATRLCSGDILFAGSGETKEEIGKCVAFTGNDEAYAGGDIVILRPQASDSRFLGYYLNSTTINRQKASRGQGDAVVHIGAAALGPVVNSRRRDRSTSFGPVSR